MGVDCSANIMFGFNLKSMDRVAIGKKFKLDDPEDVTDQELDKILDNLPDGFHYDKFGSHYSSDTTTMVCNYSDSADIYEACELDIGELSEAIKNNNFDNVFEYLGIEKRESKLFLGGLVW